MRATVSESKRDSTEMCVGYITVQMEMESDSGRGKDSIDSKSLTCSIDWYIVARVKFRREAYFIILVPAGLVCAAPNPVIPK